MGCCLLDVISADCHVCGMSSPQQLPLHCLQKWASLVGQGGVVAVVSRTHLLDGTAVRVGLVRAGLDDVARGLGLNEGRPAAENVTSE